MEVREQSECRILDVVHKIGLRGECDEDFRKYSAHEHAEEGENKVHYRTGSRSQSHIPPRLFEVARVYRNRFCPTEVEEYHAYCSYGVEVLQRIERQPSEVFRSRVAELVCHVSVSELMKRKRNEYARNNKQKLDKCVRTEITQGQTPLQIAVFIYLLPKLVPSEIGFGRVFYQR